MKLLDDQIVDAALMANAQDLPNFSKAGTGKTLTTLEAFRLTGLERFVVMCPKIALGMWKEVSEEYLGCDTQIISSAKQKLLGTTGLVLTYDVARARKAELYERYRSGALILDESHYARTVDAKRTQAIFGPKGDCVGGLAERFDQVWPLSGTPMVSYANDMYTQTAALHPDEFAAYGITSYDSFVKKFTYVRQKQYHPRMAPVWKISGNTNEELLRKIVYKDIGAIRRLEAKGLPPLRERTLSVNITLDADVRKALNGLPIVDILKTINDPDSIAAKIWRIIGLAKVPEVVPYIGDCTLDGPILVGIWHRDVANLLQEMLEKHGVVARQVNGSTSDKDREEIRNRFNSGTLPVLIGQMGAMGVSWNIQKEAAHVIILEEYPSPSVVEQFYKRVYRYGQKSAVQVDYVASDNQLDVALKGIRLKKEKSNDKING